MAGEAVAVGALGALGSLGVLVVAAPPLEALAGARWTSSGAASAMPSIRARARVTRRSGSGAGAAGAVVVAAVAVDGPAEGPPAAAAVLARFGTLPPPAALRLGMMAVLTCPRLLMVVFKM